MSNKLLLNLSNSFKTSRQNKAAMVDIKFSKRVVGVLSVLLKEGLIRGYFLKNKYAICVLLKYVNEESIVNFKNFFSAKERIYCDNSFIRNNFTSFNCCVISTKKGIMSHKEVLKSGLGGFLLLNFS